MNEFANFINSLSDHELSIFVGYQYDGLLERSKGKIAYEIKRRELSPEKIELLRSKKLIADSVVPLKTCSRCGSNKLFVETDYNEKPDSEISSVELAIDTNRCRLCGFNPDKEIPLNFFARINKIWKNYKKERVVRRKSIFKDFGA